MAAHYFFKVLRAEGVGWNPGIRNLHEANPSLYVKIRLGDVVQRTNTIKNNVSPSWEETLPLVCLTDSMSISAELRHKSRLKGRDKVIGRTKIEIAALLDSCKDGETELHILPVDGRRNPKPTATIIVHLATSDVKANAKLALDNLVRDIPPGPLSESTQSEDNVSKAGKFSTAGKKAIKKTDVFKDAIPYINSFVMVIDRIANANSYLRLAWYTVSALYTVISAQVNADDSFKSLVKTLVKIFSFVEDTEHLSDILQSLENTISELLDIITECCQLMRKHARHSFAGRSLSVGDSAKLEGQEEKVIKMKTYLHDGFVRQTAKISEDTAKQVEVLQLFQKLGTSQTDEANASDRSVCFGDTQSSTLKDIKEWVTSGSSQNIFWLNGIAGSGKSTIATTIAKEFRKSSLGAYLLFEQGKSKPGSVFRTISHRLAATNLALASRIYNACKDIDIASNTAKEDFKILFKDVLVSADDVAGPVLIILDGLGECGSFTDRRKLLRWLGHSFSKIPTKFRFLITSRPEEDIIWSLSSKPHIREVKLAHDSDSSRQDVQAYLSHALRKVIYGKEPEGWDWDMVLKVLGEAANGLFIWASTLVKFISEQTLQFQKLEEFASNPNAHTPDGLYDTVFRESINWDEKTTLGASLASHFSKIFGLILFGKEQLTNEDIDNILGLTTNEESEIILSRFQSVIIYEAGKPIRLHHASFYEYLTSDKCRDNPWFIDTIDQKQSIASSCFNVMDSLLHFNMCGLEASFSLNDDISGLNEHIEKSIPPHLNYACRFWAQHLLDAPFSVDLVEQLTIFAYDHLLYWFEVLSLTKNFYHQARQALQDAIVWLGTNEPNLSRFLTQAIKLASAFAFPIAESTPHIYVSMLALTKEDSDVSAHYMRKLPSLSLASVERKGVKQISALLKEFKGHEDGVTSVGFSPDGKRVVSGSYDKAVRVWDVESGVVIAGPFEGHTDGINSVGFSPDGKRVVSGSQDRTVLVWDVENDAVLAGPFIGHTDRVTSVGFSPDGRCVVSGSADKSIRIWDVESGLLVAGPFEEHTEEVRSTEFSPDGKRIVSGSEDNTVLVWDIESGQLITAPLKGHADWVTSVRFSSDGKYVVSGSRDNMVCVWDVDSGEIIAGPLVGHTFEVTSVVFSPDGKRVVSGSWDTKVIVWGVASGKIIAGPFEGHSGRVTSVDFSPDGKRIVSGSWDKTIRVWDIESSEDVAGPFEGHTSSVTSVEFSPDGKRIVSGSYDKTVRVWDIESGATVAGPFKGHANWVTSVGFSPDGKHVIAGSFENAVLVWDLESGLLIPDTFDGLTHTVDSDRLSQDEKYTVSISPGGSTIRVAYTKNNSDEISAGKFSNWTISEDSWIRNEEGKLLLWIPPDIRPGLCYPGEISLLNIPFFTRLDFTNYDLVEKWYN